MHPAKYDDYSDADMEDGEGLSSSSAYKKRFSHRSHHPYDDSSSTDGSPPPKPRKRIKAEPRRREAVVPSAVMRQVQLGDSEALGEFYIQCLKDMQQSGCKVLGKAWVKLLEPKKQSTYPYTGGVDRAPPWWPRKEGKLSIRHKEPDHLHKVGMCPYPLP